MKDKFVLTVSRQYGSGGRELAGILANKLNVKLYDRQIVHVAAIKLGLDDLTDEELINLENTLQPMPISTYLPFHSFGLHFGESSTGMFLAESKVIHMLANEKSCVILGRSADYVLRDEPNRFSIFVCADDDFREKRGQEVYDGKTLKELNKENVHRARYYNYYTGKTWGDGASYDLVVNTSNDPLDKIADGIIAYMKNIRGLKTI
ncbi:MAG: cytidylate kinase-like family protein [Selenomonadaceae bacterium]|nr:cytidylate kinase-like family protein [Selenomonadaceae bacterium]